MTPHDAQRASREFPNKRQCRVAAVPTPETDPFAPPAPRHGAAPPGGRRGAVLAASARGQRHGQSVWRVGSTGLAVGRENGRGRRGEYEYRWPCFARHSIALFSRADGGEAACPRAPVTFA